MNRQPGRLQPHHPRTSRTKTCSDKQLPSWILQRNFSTAINSNLFSVTVAAVHPSASDSPSSDPQVCNAPAPTTLVITPPNHVRDRSTKAYHEPRFSIQYTQAQLR